MKKLDLMGQRFGSLTVIGALPSNGTGGTRWLCRCDCGKVCEVLTQNLCRGHSTSCGCSRTKELTGQRFGKLTVLGRSEKRAPRGSRTVPLWECRCDCGALTYKATDTLTNPDVAMCAACAKRYGAEKAFASAGFVDGTQLVKLREQPLSASNTSGARGVYWEKKTNRWRARLKFKGKLMNFGSYTRFEDAVTARKRAEEEYFAAELEKYDEKP